LVGENNSAHRYALHRQAARTRHRLFDASPAGRDNHRPQMLSGATLEVSQLIDHGNRFRISLHSRHNGQFLRGEKASHRSDVLRTGKRSSQQRQAGRTLNISNPF